jgi:hypothetical protein
MNLVWLFVNQRRTTMNYKIEKNIPVSDHGKSGPWSILTNKMEIGDSILVETRKKAIAFV